MELYQVFGGAGHGPISNQLDFGGDLMIRIHGSWIRITIWIQQYLKDSLLIIAVLTDNWGQSRRHSVTTGSASRRSATNHRRLAKWSHHANIARHSSLAARVSAHYVQNCADDIQLYPWPITSVLPRHLFTDRLCSLSFSASFCWQRWHDCTTYGPRVMVRAVSASRHLRFGTCCHLISRTVQVEP